MMKTFFLGLLALAFSSQSMAFGAVASRFQNVVVSGTQTNSALGTGLVHSSAAGLFSSSLLVDADVSASAAIAYSKLAALTTNRALTSNGSGVVSVSSTSKTQLEYLGSATGTTGTTSTNLVFSTSPTLVTPNLGTPTTLVGTNITGTASGLTAGNVTTNANLTGPITSVGNATSVASQTGTGSTFVMNTSPTLVTPNLGTPSAAVLTNATGTASGLTAGNVTTNANLTGPITSVGNATSVASQTGTGSTFVMNTSPTLVTPNLGTPSTLVGTNITGTAAGLTAGNVTTNANLTGDVTSSGNATTLATVNSNVGSFGSSTSIPSFTVNAKGLVTAASGNAVVAPAGTLTGGTLASGVTASSLTSFGSSPTLLTPLITGITGTGSASAGYVGEEIVSLITTDQPFTTGQRLDIGSITLTSGDWEVNGAVRFIRNGATMSNSSFNLFFTAVSGNVATGSVFPVNGTIHSDVVPLTFDNYVMNFGPIRVVSDGTNLTVQGDIARTGQILYLKGFTGSFTGGPVNGRGMIRARRPR